MKSNKLRSISKEHVAIIQLRDAIQLYYDESYISSITLAGAAEEILGKLSDEKYSKQLGQSAKRNYADDTAFYIAHFGLDQDRLTELTEEERESQAKEIEREFIRGRNQTRNELKHKNKGKANVAYSSFKEIAADHISGAIVNYKFYKNILPEEEIILKFCLDRGIS